MRNLQANMDLEVKRADARRASLEKSLCDEIARHVVTQGRMEEASSNGSTLTSTIQSLQVLQPPHTHTHACTHTQRSACCVSGRDVSAMARERDVAGGVCVDERKAGGCRKGAGAQRGRAC